ncbi:hypothetical protein T484DRAFT_2102418 [Baffinella frigidus]|nr:hypothetical protein T484DRAFT_2102418 [Cryptophyta sp. CCMP2293]
MAPKAPALRKRAQAAPALRKRAQTAPVRRGGGAVGGVGGIGGVGWHGGRGEMGAAGAAKRGAGCGGAPVVLRGGRRNPRISPPHLQGAGGDRPTHSPPEKEHHALHVRPTSSPGVSNTPPCVPDTHAGWGAVTLSEARMAPMAEAGLAGGLRGPRPHGAAPLRAGRGRARARPAPRRRGGRGAPHPARGPRPAAVISLKCPAAVIQGCLAHRNPPPPRTLQ